MKKAISFFAIPFITFSLMISSCCCAARPDQGAETPEGDHSTGQTVLDDTKAWIPIPEKSVIDHSGMSEEEGDGFLFIQLECPGSLTEISDWYIDALEENWQLSNISEGDFDTWGEFYAEAEKEGNMLVIYLYQDHGEGHVCAELKFYSGTPSDQEGLSLTSEEDSLNEEEQERDISVSSDRRLEGIKTAFVCASVGANWNINGHFPHLDIDVYDEYQFDKGHVIRDVLESHPPDIMTIKECAAYFPPESQGYSMSEYKRMIEQWTELCIEEDVAVVLTTVVPIDPSNPLNWDGQLDSLLKYNDWVLDYCQRKGFSVLDLEKALRVSESDRNLDPRYDSGDGLHPNELAYTEKLDDILIPSLVEALGQQNN